MAANYNESEKVKRLAEDMALHEAKNPGEWSGGTYGKGMDEALQKVLNRDKFQYDINGDALYQQYKDRYIQQGKQAMMDTMGQAAALTGGYGNSYAQKAGQQAYQGYLQGLNDKVPELYQLALERYNQEGTDLLNKYGLMSDQYAKEYSQYRDSVGDWQAQRDYLANLYNNERSFDYTGYRDRVADEQWQKNFDEALRQYNENLAEQKRQYDASLASRYSSGGSSGGSGNSGSGKQYDTHGYTEGQIKALQRNAGLTPDGVWGAQTEKAYQNGYRWNSYRGATDKNGAMNQSYFDAYMSGIASNLRNGNTDSAKASAQQIVNSLSDEQYAKMKSVFAAHGISIG